MDDGNWEFKIYEGSAKVIYFTNETINREVVEKIIKWCEKYGCHSGEMLMQDDDCQIYSSVLISQIIDDILKFKTIYDEE